MINSDTISNIIHIFAYYEETKIFFNIESIANSSNNYSSIRKKNIILIPNSICLNCHRIYIYGLNLLILFRHNRRRYILLRLLWRNKILFNIESIADSSILTELNTKSI